MKLSDFKNCYCICLNRQKEEYTAFEYALPKDLPFAVNKYNAIDGTLCVPPSWWGATPGAWGCYKSHLNLIEQAYNEGWENVLLLEVDAFFSERFTERADAALSELPKEWDCLYFGGQMIKTNLGVAKYYSDHLVKPFNCNRTHAWALSKSGIEKVYKRLNECGGWPKRWHFDHWVGQLHEDGSLNAFACYPFMTAQKAGHSTTMDREETFHDWNWGGIVRNWQISKNVNLVYGAAGFGVVGTEGALGYEAKTAMPEDREPGKIPLSLHAPSQAIIDITGTEPIFVYPRMSSFGGSIRPVQFKVNGIEITTVQQKEEKGKGLKLNPGRHEIEFDIKGGNGCAMTYLVFEDEPFNPVPEPKHLLKQKEFHTNTRRHEEQKRRC